MSDDDHLFNRQKQLPRRQALRKNQTEPEKRLWFRIRDKQLGVKFRRQQGIGPYVVDFYCAECGLIIEMDGDSHFHVDAIAYDQSRDTFLREKGLIVLRFNNQQIMQEMDAVLHRLLDEIEITLRRNTAPPPAKGEVGGG